MNINPNKSGQINFLDNSCNAGALRVRDQTKSTSTNLHVDDGRREGEEGVGRLTESNLTSC